MADKIVAQAKEKEFDRLREYSLNQISLIECGLNPQSQSRNPYAMSFIIVPLESEILLLFNTLMELRENYLTFEERKLLEEETKLLT